MVNRKPQHSPQLGAPWYAEAGDGTVLHRYMTDEFIPNFLQESAQGLLTGNRHQAWQQEDKFGDTRTRLRLPVHRTFYVVATEAVCNIPWQPAFSPKKIISAGFVVRKKTPQGIQIWRMRNGAAVGWQNPDALDLTQDPDQSRRLRLNPELKIRGFTLRESSATGYSGEQTYPLHVHVVARENRHHSLLYGFLPLSGSRDAEEIPLAQTADTLNGKNNSVTGNNQQVSAAGYLAELEWPFGSWDGVTFDRASCTCSGSMQDIITRLCDKFSWSANLQLQVNNSIPTRAFSLWLGMLVNRYQVFDSTLGGNAGLRELLEKIPRFTRKLTASELTLMNTRPQDFIRYLQQHSLVDGNLWNYVEREHEAISTWYSQQELAFAELQPKPASWGALPAFSGCIYFTESLAAMVRGQMLQRAELANQLVESALPLPRYTQANDETYFVLPFIRYRDECDCEKMLWGQPSFDFKVASPFDAQATRPTVIQLPELRDIKKGFAKGVTFLTPKSIADAMLKIAPTMDMKTRESRSPLDACLGFSISFSIPIITICAMILLMIVLNLLNLIFRWIPYAILILPRLCKP